MSGKKPQFCKTCGRPLKGHVGQHGAKCKMHDGEDVDGALRSLNKPTSVSNLSQLRSPPHSTPTIVDSAINELSNQVALLAAKVETIVLDKQRPPATQKRKSKRKLIYDSDSSSADSDSAMSSKASTICLSNGARVSLRTVKAAQAGEFADLNNFLPTPTIAHKTLSVEKHQGKPTIHDFFGWLTAYTGYMEAILKREPNRWNEFMKHRMNIMEFDVRYSWAAVYTYDLQFRSKMAINNSLDLGHIDSDIMLRILTPDTLREEPRVCFRCKSPFHYSKNCPFRQGTSLETAQKKIEGPTAKGSARSMPTNPFYNQQRQNECCHNWNRGHCKQGDKCVRQHKCSGCGSAYPNYQCYTCNPPPNWGSNTQYTQGQLPPSFTNQRPNAPYSVATQPPNMGRVHGISPQ